MNDRLFTLLCAVGAFALFYAFFIGDAGRDDENAPSRPLSTESRPNGYRGLADWLAAGDIRTESLRHRYDWLPSAANGLPRTGNVLIVSLPTARDVRNRETSDLTDWVRQGNTLVIVAGLFDTPEWGVEGGDILGDLKRMTLLDFKVYEPEDKNDDSGDSDGPGESDGSASPASEAAANLARLLSPKAERMSPRGAHPLTAGVEAVSALSEYWSYKFTVSSPDEGAVLELMDDVGTGLPALWAGPLGSGTIVISAYGSIFTNKLLGHADNARLMSNLIAWRLAPQGVVLFDDMHQGASSFYDPEAFFDDSRLHATFWWIIGLWFVWAVLATKLRVVQPALGPLREVGFIRAIGNFFARTVPVVAVGERLCAHLFNDIRQRLGWPQNGEPVWDWLRSLTAVPASEVMALERMHSRLAAGHKVDLSRLQNLILSVRKQVL